MERIAERNWWPLALIVAYVVGVLPSLGQTLLETHAHRQTQTAYTAVLYARDGIDLLRPPLPVLGPPGVIPQEFPVFQAAGALVIDLGIPADAAMRLVGLASFVVCAVFVYLLAVRVLGGRFVPLIVLGAFLFNPHAWLYGRTSLMEYLAAAAAVAMLYFAVRWLDGGHPGHWLAAAVAGALGVLVKITTGAFYLGPLLLWRSPSGRWGFQRLSVWGLIGVTMVIGFGWSAYAQGVREETPAAIFLSMENQYGWFFGSLVQRLDVGSWRVPVVGIIALTGFGFVLWAPLAVARARSMRQSAFLLALLALVVVIPFTLFNLYAVHDYYLVAIAPVIAIGIGLGASWLGANVRRRWVRRARVGLAGAWVATVIGMFASWSIVYGPPGEEARAMRIASFIHDNSASTDWVVLQGWGWNSTFLYYADRRGLAVPEADPALAEGEFAGQDLSDIDLKALLANPTLGPFITCDHAANCTVDSRP